MTVKAKRVLTFNGDKKVKDFYIARVKAHQLADEIQHGFFWENGKGCAVGCMVETGSNPHETLAKAIGIPLSMAHLIDLLFEGQSNGTAKAFPLKFIKAVSVGVDVVPVMDRFLYALLSDKKHGAIAKANDRARPAIQAVIDAYGERIAGRDPGVPAWRKLGAAAYAACVYAAAAAYAAYAACVYAAAAAYAAYAAYAADAAADAADDARANHYTWQAELLISLLKKAGK